MLYHHLYLVVVLSVTNEMQLHQLHDSYESHHLTGPPLETLQCDQVVSIGQPPWGNGEFLYKIATFSKSQKNWGERLVPEGEAAGRGPPRNFEDVVFKIFFLSF